MAPAALKQLLIVERAAILADEPIADLRETAAAWAYLSDRPPTKREANMLKDWSRGDLIRYILECEYPIGE